MSQSDHTVIQGNKAHNNLLGNTHSFNIRKVCIFLLYKTKKDDLHTYTTL